MLQSTVKIAGLQKHHVAGLCPSADMAQGSARTLLKNPRNICMEHVITQHKRIKSGAVFQHLASNIHNGGVSTAKVGFLTAVDLDCPNTSVF